MKHGRGNAGPALQTELFLFYKTISGVRIPRLSAEESYQSVCFTDAEESYCTVFFTD